jgi:hypothetical protein
MRGGATVVVAVGLALAAAVATGCGPPWRTPDPPGEWGDAAAAGSGYGTGLARQAHTIRGDRSEPGPGPVDNTRELALKKRAADNPDAGAGDAGAGPGR